MDLVALWPPGVESPVVVWPTVPGRFDADGAVALMDRRLAGEAPSARLLRTKDIVLC